MKTLKNLLIGAFILAAVNSYSQCDSIALICNDHITSGFISDGQMYRALLIDDQLAEFHTTFYGDAKYRIAACSGTTDGNLLFRVFDEERKKSEEEEFLKEEELKQKEEQRRQKLLSEEKNPNKIN